MLFYGENCFISQNIGPKANFDLKLVRNFLFSTNIRRKLLLKELLKI